MPPRSSIPRAADQIRSDQTLLADLTCDASAGESSATHFFAPHLLRSSDVGVEMDDDAEELEEASYKPMVEASYKGILWPSENVMLPAALESD